MNECDFSSEDQFYKELVDVISNENINDIDTYKFIQKTMTKTDKLPDSAITNSLIVINSFMNKEEKIQELSQSDRDYLKRLVSPLTYVS